MMTSHDHKRSFHTRLRDFVHGIESQGWSVIIAGDINIARSPVDGFPGIRLASPHVINRQDFERKFMASADGGIGMIDSFRHLHGYERKFTYRSPSRVWGSSCDRVDMILLSRGLEENLKEADILDEERERGPSDHLPSYATIDVCNLKPAKLSVGDKAQDVADNVAILPAKSPTPAAGEVENTQQTVMQSQVYH